MSVKKYKLLSKPNVTKDLLVKSLRLLSSKGRKRYLLSIVFQILLTFLDLLAILFLALIGNLVVSLNGLNQSGPLVRILNLLNLENSATRIQLLVLASLTLTFFIVRTLLSARLIKYFYDFLATEASQLSSRLIGNYMKYDLVSLRKTKESSTIYSLTGSIDSWAFNILGSFSTILSESILVIGITLALVLYEPFLSFASIFYFSSLVIFIHLITTKLLRNYGEELTAESLRSHDLISNILHGFRDIYTKNRMDFFLKQVLTSRNGKLRAQATINFLPNVGKYILEVGLVFGVLIVFIMNLNSLQTDDLVKILVVFFVVSSRLTPSLLRIQQNYFNLKAFSSNTAHAISLWESRNWVEPSSRIIETEHSDFLHKEFISQISVQNLNFTFEDDKPLITNMNFSLKGPGMVGIIGHSGIGKSTLLDCILGLLEPKSGSVIVSGLNPREAIEKWPGAIGFLPQLVPIFDGTIVENICFGFNHRKIPESNKEHAVNTSGLSKVLIDQNFSLETKLGHSGILLSGGQKQRLGLARALITLPKIIIADEPTNSLDPRSKKEICESLSTLSSESLVIVITHDSMLTQYCSKILEMGTDGNFSLKFQDKQLNT